MAENSELIMSLGKVIIAAAWADGDLTNDEINSLKDLLFRLPGLNARDWARLEIYIDSPVEEAERQRLITDLQSKVTSDADRQLVTSALDELVEADGVITDEERAVEEEIKQAIGTANSGSLGKLNGLVRGAVGRRSETVAGLPNRELYYDDFVKNKIYYSLQRRLDLGEVEIDLPDAELRRLSLAGGLLARVAHTDDDISDAEFDSISASLKNHWSLDEQAAAFVTEVAASEVGGNVDYFRLSREFYEVTEREERIHFVETLFSVAAADSQVSFDETEEVRQIANQLKLTHKEFINAKLTVPAQNR